MPLHRKPVCFLIGATLLMAACSESPSEPEMVAETSALRVMQSGSGLLSGAHHTLDIVGVPKGMSVDVNQGGGNVVYVGIGGTTGKKMTRILAYAGNEFLVLDRNGIDGRASFQLPASGLVLYEVFVRTRPPSGGGAALTLCAAGPGEDDIAGTADDVENCGVGEVFLSVKGKKFMDVSETLLYVSASVDPESALGTCLGLDRNVLVDEPVVQTSIDVFHDCLQGYLWDYTSSGFKLLQFRFSLAEVVD